MVSCMISTDDKGRPLNMKGMTGWIRNDWHKGGNSGNDIPLTRKNIKTMPNQRTRPCYSSE